MIKDIYRELASSKIFKWRMLFILLEDLCKNYDAGEWKDIRKALYEQYLNSDEWKKLANLIKFSAKKKCEHCGSSDGLQVHHKTYERIGFELPEDLMVLCSGCHKKIHNITS